MIYDFVNQPTHYEDIKKRAKGMAKKKPVNLPYFILSSMEHFVTSSGVQTGYTGDYVLIGKDHAWPVSPSYFKENYDEVKDDGKVTP